MVSAVAAKERPILFSTAMVQAINRGIKTQTRRIVKWKPREEGLNLSFSGLEVGYYCTGVPESGFVLQSRGNGGCWNDRTYPIHCPYGKVGDRLWVRETWSPDHAAFYPHFRYVYKADEYPSRFDIDNGKVYSSEAKAWFPFKWRPSIHMPRPACRLRLELTEVRIERLHAITEEDAIAEGAQCAGFPAALTNYGAFGRLWQKINGNESWDANPFVWVLGFERVEASS